MVPAKILVVEDEGIVALDLKTKLQGMGHEVIGIASSGEQAVQKAGETLPDLVLMDIGLKGGMDGVEAAEQIRTRFDIPVIYVTAYADEITLQRAVITEPGGYILKPFKYRDLQVAVDLVLYKHRLQTRLKETERRLSTVLKSIGEAVIATDIDGRVVFMNPVAEALTGWSQEDASGRALSDIFNIVDSETRASVLIPPARAIGESAEIDGSNRAMLMGNDGRERPIAGSAAPIRNERDNVVGVVLVFSDVTERRKAEGELRRAKDTAEAASRAKSEFLATMSHELRTPLHQITGFTELVINDPHHTLGDKQRRYLNLSLQSSQHLLSLINDILDISKIEAGKARLELSEVDLASLLEESLVMVREKALKNKLDISLRVASIPDKIIADDRMLRQILYNLLSNAVKFTGDGGSIQLRAVSIAWVHGRLMTSDGKRIDLPKKAGGRILAGIGFVEVTVVDTGVGIQEENLERIFNPFEQVDSSFVRKFEGTGLGLALTREFVQLHGGRIWAESQGVGKGSTFRFVIPVSQAPGVDIDTAQG